MPKVTQPEEAGASFKAKSAERTNLHPIHDRVHEAAPPDPFPRPGSLRGNWHADIHRRAL